MRERRPVAAIYQGVPRVLCPHALGWKGGRAKVLSLQSGGRTSAGPLPAAPEARWRCMFVADVEAATIVDAPWESADNYSGPHPCLDIVAAEVEATTPP